MKCLSVQQPWAWLLAHQHKDIENRTWPTRVRGWVLLHAGRNLDLAAWPAIAHQMPHLTLPSQFEIERGAIVGAMRIDDCVTSSASPWFSGPHGFAIGAAVAFERPVPWRGALGFFNVELHPEPAGLDLIAQIPMHVAEGVAR